MYRTKDSLPSELRLAVKDKNREISFTFLCFLGEMLPSVSALRWIFATLTVKYILLYSLSENWYALYMKLNVNSPLRLSLMSSVSLDESNFKSAALSIYSACKFISQSTSPQTIVTHELVGSQKLTADPEDTAAQYCPVLQA